MTTDDRIGNIEIIEAESDFKRVHKAIIENRDIDCLTLGVFVRILVLGRTWKLNVKGLSFYLNVSDKKIRDAIKSLEKAGFITRHAVKDSLGKFKGWSYKIYAQPIHGKDRTAAGTRSTPKTDTPQNGLLRERTTPLPDYTEKGGVINNKPNELIDLNNNKTIREHPQFLKNRLERELYFKEEVEKHTDYSNDMRNAFFLYWSEPDKTGYKMRYELERTWDIERRLKSWHSHEAKFGNKQKPAPIYKDVTPTQPKTTSVNAVSFDEYQQLKRRAEQGDMEAMKKLSPNN